MSKSSDVARIRHCQAGFVDALRCNNFKILKSLFLQPAVLLPPASEIVVGSQAIVEYWKGAEHITDVDFVTTSTQRLCDVGFRESGALLLTMHTARRGSFVQAAKFVTTWVKESSDWKIDAMAWNAVTRPNKALSPVIRLD